MSSQRREQPGLIEIEYSRHDGASDGGGDGGHGHDERGVRWTVVVLGTIAVLALGGLGVVAVTRDEAVPADSTIATPTTEVPEGGALDEGTLAPEPTVVPLVAEDMTGWPADAVLIVAGEQGVDRMEMYSSDVGAATDGSVGVAVTRVPGTDGVPVVRAFEVEDGSFVYQPKDGDILWLTGNGQATMLVAAVPGLLLEDADMPGADPARLRLVYREPSDDPSATFRLTIRSGATTSSVLVPGGWGVSYERFVLYNGAATVGTTWVDDSGVRGTAFAEFFGGQVSRFSFDPAGEPLLRIASDPNDGAAVSLGLDGLTTSYEASPRAIDTPVSISEVDLRGSSMAVQRGGEVEYYDLEPYRRWSVPTMQQQVSFVSVSRLVHSPRIDNFLSVFSEGSPRACVVGQYLAHATIGGAESGTVEMSPDQVAAAEAIVVDGFPALLLESADGSFLIRITSDVCVLYLTAAGISRRELFTRLAEVDVGHAGFIEY